MQSAGYVEFSEFGDLSEHDEDAAIFVTEDGAKVRFFLGRGMTPDQKDNLKNSITVRELFQKSPSLTNDFRNTGAK